MAIRNPNENESIKEYDELQTEEMNKVADYVVEIGSATNWQFTKWNSGKLEMTRSWKITSQDELVGVPVDLPVALASRFTNEEAMLNTFHAFSFSPELNTNGSVANMNLSQSEAVNIVNLTTLTIYARALPAIVSGRHRIVTLKVESYWK